MTVLGCGAAGGVPLIGNHWGACNPENPRNRRRRASILVEAGETRLLVDTGPDVRVQLLDAGVMRLDGILYTHTHADHCHGIDEVRALNRLQRDVIDAYGTEGDLNELMKRFGYVFDSPKTYNGEVSYYKPCLNPRRISHGVAFDARGIGVLPFAQDHGFVTTTGFRFGDFAYTTDAVALGDDAFAALAGVRTWIVGCLQHEPHPTHAHLRRALDWIARVGPERAVLTHLSHRLDYDSLAEELPRNVAPAHDGLVLDGI